MVNVSGLPPAVLAAAVPLASIAVPGVLAAFVLHQKSLRKKAPKKVDNARLLPKKAASAAGLQKWEVIIVGSMGDEWVPIMRITAYGS